MGRRIMRTRRVLIGILCTIILVAVTGCVQGFLASIELKINRDNAPEPKLFWTDRTDNVIQTSDLDGKDVTDVVNIAGLYPYVLAIDRQNGKIYWSTTVSRKIQRAHLDGSKVADLVTSGLVSEVHGIALDVDRGYMYCTDDGNLYKIPIDGGTKNALDYVLDIFDIDGDPVTITNPSGIAINLKNDKIYWCLRSPINAVYQAKLDGTGATGLIAFNLDTPRDIEVDPEAQMMYWVDSGNGTLYASTIVSPDIDANNHVLISGLSEPYGLTLDLERGRLYWTDVTDDKIYRALLNGTGQAALPVPGLADANDVELYY